MFAAPALEPILHCNVSERAKADPMIKTTNTLAELERIARCIQQRRSDCRAYRDCAGFSANVRGEPDAASHRQRARIRSYFRELIRPTQARYDLAW
jgi:hypothetical protein